eukprot:1240620-Prymnesium_polylepis.3
MSTVWTSRSPLEGLKRGPTVPACNGALLRMQVLMDSRFISGSLKSAPYASRKVALHVSMPSELCKVHPLPNTSSNEIWKAASKQGLRARVDRPVHNRIRTDSI